MTGSKHLYIAAGVLTIPLLGSAIEATAEPQWVPQAEQGRQAQARESMRWRAMDTNGDGRITRSEWRGNARAFDNHDWNNDGVLSGDEVRPAAAQADRSREWTAERFAELDRNRDNRLTRSEWQDDVESFERADRNSDNRLTRAEFLRGAPAGAEDSAERFEALDANGNGRIERREWQGTRDGFDWLDRNNDGTLSRAETVGNDSVAGDATTFRSLDVDRSGTIEMDEWPGTRNTFAMRDRNGDWRLTEDEAGELRAAGTSGQTGTEGETVRVSAQERWTDTGLDVRNGDLLRVRADGTVVLSGNNQGNDTGNAAGAFSGRRAQGALIPTATAGALIARIGDGPAFLIGSEDWTQRASRSVRLFLGINDDHLADNRGELRVQVSIGR